jgi:SAM-dependent methyltransferase
VGWLKKLQAGTFLDYGCGDAVFLNEARKLRWNVIGVEFEADVAKSVSNRTGIRIVTDTKELGIQPIADVLHLGDVLEHLTRVNQQLPEVLKLLKPGGILLAQGPLENNTTPFTIAVRWNRSRRNSLPLDAPPYHVVLATSRGQQILFRRFGLTQIDWSVREVSWPAPSKLTSEVISNPRELVMWGLRRFSQVFCLVSGRNFGNRYYYSGRVLQ